MKGHKTTEFWGVLIAAVLAVANSAFGLGLSDATIATVAGAAGAYAIARGQAKKAGI